MPGTVVARSPRATTQQVRSNAEFAAGLSRYARGTCVDIDWVNNLALVNIPGGNVWIPMVGTAPIPQWEVYIGFIGNQPVCLGVVPRSPMCTVTAAPAGGVVKVRGDDGRDYTVTLPTGLSLVVNDRVIVLWAESGGGAVLMKPQADPFTRNPYITAPPVVPIPTRHESIFNATDSGSQPGSGSSGSGSYFTPRVFCSDNNLGGYFYNDAIYSTIRNATSIESVQVYVDAVQTSGAAPTLGGHSLASKSGNIAVSAAVNVPGGSGWKDVTHLAAALKAGTVKGFATAHGGYHIWNNAGINMSGRCRIVWNG